MDYIYKGQSLRVQVAIRLSYNTQPSLPLIYTVVILSTLFLHTHPYNRQVRLGKQDQHDNYTSRYAAAARSKILQRQGDIATTRRQVDTQRRAYC
jgi:hypothetical protein